MLCLDDRRYLMPEPKMRKGESHISCWLVEDASFQEMRFIEAPFNYTFSVRSLEGMEDEVEEKITIRFAPDNAKTNSAPILISARSLRILLAAKKLRKTVKAIAATLACATAKVEHFKPEDAYMLKLRQHYQSMIEEGLKEFGLVEETV